MSLDHKTGHKGQFFKWKSIHHVKADKPSIDVWFVKIWFVQYFAEIQLFKYLESVCAKRNRL